MTKDVKRLLVDTSKEMLLSSDDVEGVTAREITAKAGVNLAMINYYFRSKDELLKTAVDEILAEEFEKYAGSDSADPKEKLRSILLHVSHAVVKYSRFTKVSIPYILLNDEITLPYDILPYIREHFNGTKSDFACKMVAFELVYLLQLIFCRSDEFYKYSGVSVKEPADVTELVSFLIDQLLGGK